MDTREHLWTNLGLKGFCFVNFPDNNDVARMVKECGLNKLDISGCQLNPQETARHAEVIDLYRQAGITLIGGGVYGLDADEDAQRNVFTFAKRAGFSTVSVNFQPNSWAEALPLADRLAEEFGFRLAIHNHGGKHWLGNSQMLSHVLDLSSDRVGLCIDTAWAIHSGENPLDWLDRFGERIYAVHYKDFLFDRHGKHEDVIVGEGTLDLPAFLRGLIKLNFSGPACLEYEGDPDNPVPAIRRCVAAFRETWEAL